MVKTSLLKFIFFSAFSLAHLSCKTNDSSLRSESNTSASAAEYKDRDTKLLISKALVETFAKYEISNAFEDEFIKGFSGGMLRVTGTLVHYFNGNIISTKRGTCLGIKKGTKELEVTNSDDSINVGCSRIYLFAKKYVTRNPSNGMGLSHSNHGLTRIVFNHGGGFYCLQANGLSKRATIEPCLAEDPNNIQTFDWDTGKRWGLIRQSGDHKKALCLDIENEDHYDTINFYSCTETNSGGKGIHQRFWFRKYNFLNAKGMYNKLTPVD